ncbi:MAG: hypothetical protein QW324_05810 [Thermofilaceae archaeon]
MLEEIEGRVEEERRWAAHWSRRTLYLVSTGRAPVLLDVATKQLERVQYGTRLLLRGKRSYTDAYYDVWEEEPPLPSEVQGRYYPLDYWARCVLAQEIVLITALRGAGEIGAGKPLLRNLIVTIQGRRGTGKTTYAVWCTVAALREIGFSEREALDYVRRYIVWSPEDLIAKLTAMAREGAWLPAIILDDAGTWLTKYWWFGSRRERRGMVALSKLLDTMKDMCGVVIATTPSFKKLVSFLRDFSDYVITGRSVNDRGRIMNEFRWIGKLPATTSTGGEQELGTLFIDLTPPDALMPQDIWESMMATRAELREAHLLELAESIWGGEEGGEE